jgi:hypothetical protein
MYYYVNVDSTSPMDGWVTCMPIGKKENLEEKPTPVKYFDTRSDAKEYLDVVRSMRLSEWEKNRYFYEAHGYRKPQWKIYEEKI